jgi:hypothetical protein
MIFHITQTHRPERCPKDEGGSQTLVAPRTEGVRLLATYASFSEHVIYYLVEADDIKAVNQFLLSGSHRCDCKVTPVSCLFLANPDRVSF